MKSKNWFVDKKGNIIIVPDMDDSGDWAIVEGFRDYNDYVVLITSWEWQ